MSELVRYAVADGVARITLDSPHNRNALSRQLLGELLAALARAAEDPTARAVVIDSSGRVFCSGADLAEATGDGMATSARQIVAVQRAIVAHPKPVVAVVAGPVRAGGLGIVAASDLALVAEEATFALTEVKLGLAAAVISLTVHHRMAPRAAALTTLGGAVFDGRAAVDYGLATRAVPAAQLDEEVRALCAELVTGSPQGLRESKALLNRDLLARFDERGADVAELSAHLFASPEAQAAMAAFLGRGAV
ncbi:MAG: enoyl-CoA hydratase-related protein [Nocardioides sp.]